MDVHDTVRLFVIKIRALFFWMCQVKRKPCCHVMAVYRDANAEHNCPATFPAPVVYSVNAMVTALHNVRYNFYKVYYNNSLYQYTNALSIQ